VPRGGECGVGGECSGAHLVDELSRVMSKREMDGWCIGPYWSVSPLPTVCGEAPLGATRAARGEEYVRQLPWGGVHAAARRVRVRVRARMLEPPRAATAGAAGAAAAGAAAAGAAAAAEAVNVEKVGNVDDDDACGQALDRLVVVCQVQCERAVRVGAGYAVYRIAQGYSQYKTRLLTAVNGDAFIKTGNQRWSFKKPNF